MKKIFKRANITKKSNPNELTEARIKDRSSFGKLTFVETKMQAKAAEKLKKGKYEKALFFLEQVLVTRKFQYGPGHHLVNEVHLEIADTLKLLKRDTEAQYHFLTARNDLNFSAEHNIIPSVSLDESRRTENKTTNAVRAQNEKLLLDLKKKLSTREQLYGNDHKLVKEVHLEIANTLTILGRENEANHHYNAVTETNVDSSSSLRQIRGILTETKKPEEFSLSRTEKVSPSTLQLCFGIDVGSNYSSKRTVSKVSISESYQSPNHRSVRKEKMVTTSFISLIKKNYTS